MAKLSSAHIKELIADWVSTPQARAQLDLTDSNSDELWELWCDPKQWNPDGEEQAKPSMFRTPSQEVKFVDGKRICTYVEVPYFDIDVIGGSDEALVKKYFDDPKAAAKCILRIFIPHDEFGDNYRLEVITTPEDDAVIGWTVIVD